MAANFFVIGKTQWADACKLGMNPAIAFLVLARGTGGDNITTSWSAEAVRKTAGIAWVRANDAIEILEKARLVSRPPKKSGRPSRKLSFPKDQDKDAVLWLPNSLVDGVGGKSSPIERLRQTQNVAYLQSFVDLYGEHNLVGECGLSRGLVWQKFSRTHVFDYGQFRFYGFSSGGSTCYSKGPLERFHVGKKPEGEYPSWTFLHTLERLGLLEVVHYVAEGDSSDAELKHALTGDELADEVKAALDGVIERFEGEWQAKKVESRGFDYVIPAPVTTRPLPSSGSTGWFIALGRRSRQHGGRPTWRHANATSPSTRPSQRAICIRQSPPSWHFFHHIIDIKDLSRLYQGSIKVDSKNVDPTHRKAPPFNGRRYKKRAYAHARARSGKKWGFKRKVGNVAARPATVTRKPWSVHLA